MLKIATVLAIGGFFLLSGCDSAPSNYSLSAPDQGLIYEGPFAVRYLTSKSAEVKYAGQTYQISDGINHSEYPFQYAFEEDGDIDLILNGREYEIESPEDAFDDAMEDLFSDKHTRKINAATRPAPLSLYKGLKPVAARPSAQPPSIRPPAKSQPYRRK